jgi:ABC-type multidrug transport system fused ATPase/permease subunit
MVLEQGVLKELDSPQTLLGNPEGLFHSLWQRHVKSHGKEE